MKSALIVELNSQSPFSVEEEFVEHAKNQLIAPIVTKQLEKSEPLERL
jgi:hypothetical protein